MSLTGKGVWISLEGIAANLTKGGFTVMARYLVKIRN
jgi:hypothetical protein